MGKTAITGSLLAFIFICANLGVTVHAAELKKPRQEAIAPVAPAAPITLAKQDKVIIIDGVEYVPKEKSSKKNNDLETPKQTKTTARRSVTYADNTPSVKLENFAMKGNYGVGLEASVVNLGIGPSAEYWFTDNMVLSGHLGLGTFTSYGLRGDYVFSKPIKLLQTYTAEPYVGIGYTSIKGPEMTAGSIKVKTEGSGVDIHAGLFMPAQDIYKNVACRAEIAYSTATVEATATDNTGFFDTSTKVSGGYSSFGLGFGIYYYFD